MKHRSLRVLLVSLQDVYGGAERMAWNLFKGAQAQGVPCWLAVNRKVSDDPDVLVIPNRETLRGPWFRFWRGLYERLNGIRGAGQLARVSRWLSTPGYWLETFLGIEDFRFPATWKLLTLPPQLPSVVHCHNLHGGYFDLRALAWLSRQVPVVLTLHDAWLLSGHCSHSYDCQRWQTGCGHCPDLTLYPEIRRDATAYNWRRKRRIYQRSRLFVATPCQWLMDKVHRSMLAPGVREGRVIPNGVDLTVFRPADRQAVRATLGLPATARVLLFTANKWIRESRIKDYPTMRTAVARAADRLAGPPVVFVALGEDRPKETIGTAEVRFVPFQPDPAVVASYYQAADLYLHAAHVDTFPTTILEALACGTPVVATAVSGIPEQIKGLNDLAGSGTAGNHYGAQEATGILVPPGGGMEMAAAIESLLSRAELLRQLAANPRQDAQGRFDLNRQVDRYLAWYQELLSSGPGPAAERLHEAPRRL